MGEPSATPFRVPISADAAVTAHVYVAVSGRVPPRAPRSARSPASEAPSLLLAHGAGAGQHHPYIVGTAERLSERGVSVVTFDFLYTERGKKLPDRNDVLEACFLAVFQAARARTAGPLFTGGKSMGGRIASQVAAKGEIDPAGLVFLGYPLHPPGTAAARATKQAKQERSAGVSARSKREPRDKHLGDVRSPMLFVQGTRDAFGTAAEIAPIVSRLGPGSKLVAVEGGDHSHTVPKRGAITQEATLAAIADEIATWMRARVEAMGRGHE